MPLTRAAQQDREAQTVRSAPGRSGFHAPDLAAVDTHLRRLSSGLHAGTLTEVGERRVREDIDALLSRRLQAAPDMKAWDTLGMIEFARRQEQAAACEREP